MSEAPDFELQRFVRMPPGVRDWCEFVEDFSDHPKQARPLMAAFCSMVTRSGSARLDLKRLDRDRLKAVGVGRVALRLVLEDFAQAGFLVREGEGKAAVYSVRDDIACELLGERASRRAELRVIPGGKG